MNDKNVLKSFAKSTSCVFKSTNIIVNEIFNIFSCFRRDKEEGTNDDNDEDDETIKNGFVPIENAVKNAEVRSAAATTIDDGKK